MRTLVFILALLALVVGFDSPEPQVVGFDIDDCLLYSSPAFAGHVGADGTIDWKSVNESDHLSLPILEVVELVKSHRACDVYFITSRQATEGETLSKRVEEVTGVPASHVYFSKEKDGLIRKLGISVFYGDSDSDIVGARKGGARGIRVPRLPSSSYKKSYNPGSLGEEILDITPTLGR